MKLINNPYITFLFRIVLGGIFICASVDKIINPLEFAADIRNYEILPESITNITAIFLPWLELYCGLFLISGIFTRSSAFILTFMIIIFIAAIASASARGLDIDCGCYRTIHEASKVGLRHILEDILYLIMALQIIFSNSSFACLEKIWIRENNV